MSTRARRPVPTLKQSTNPLESTGLPERRGSTAATRGQEHISIVVPAFNEERRIERTVRAIFDYMVMNHRIHEVIIADDGSLDGTGEVVARLQREVLPIKFLRSERNRGKGNAVRRGVVASTGDLVLVTDADLSTPIEELEKLLERVQEGADIAIGSRGLRDSQLGVRQPFYHELLGKTFNLLVQWTILPGIWDTQCGFKLFRGPLARKLFAHATIDGFAFDVEVLGLAAWGSCKLAEVPVRWSHVANGNKLRLARDAQDSMTMFRDIIKVAYRLRNGWYELAAISSPASGAEPVVIPDET